MMKKILQNLSSLHSLHSLLPIHNWVFDNNYHTPYFHQTYTRDRTRSVRQEQENPGRARAATLHPNHEPEREAQERGERVKCFASCRISAVLTCKYEILKNSDKTEQSSGQFI